MINLLMLLADGVEECEALVTRDVLLRGGINVVMTSIMGRDVVVSQNNFLVKCDTAQEVDLKEFDGLILPGGGRGTQNLDRYEKMNDILAYFVKNDKLVAAICAAPMVIAHRNYLVGKKFTCFKGCEEGLNGLYTNKEVERDGQFITARSMYYASNFALEIIKYFFGEEKTNQVERSIKSL